MGEDCSPDTGVGMGCRDFESVTLMRMRQKAERDRLIAEIQAAD